MNQKLLITIYSPDGTVASKAVGFTGGQCNVAAKPYEEMAIAGQLRKAPTGDACLPPPVPVEDRLAAS